MYSKIPYLFSLSFLLFLSACNNSPSTQEAETSTATEPTISEEALVSQLAVDFISNPSSQADEEQNKILNYAIDHLLAVERTPTGLYLQIVHPGEGQTIEWGDLTTVHYKGQFLDGRVFDSSYKREKPLESRVGNMIQGWNEALQQLKPGGKAVLLIPSRLAYAGEGLITPTGDTLVPPNTVLRFDLEVLEVEKM